MVSVSLCGNMTLAYLNALHLSVMNLVLTAQYVSQYEVTSPTGSTICYCWIVNALHALNILNKLSIMLQVNQNKFRAYIIFFWAHLSPFLSIHQKTLNNIFAFCFISHMQSLARYRQKLDEFLQWTSWKPVSSVLVQMKDWILMKMNVFNSWTSSYFADDNLFHSLFFLLIFAGYYVDETRTSAKGKFFWHIFVQLLT